MRENGESQKFHIRGGEVFVTEDSRKAYRVLEGSILVYLMPKEGDGYGRRMFLLEMGEGTEIPGFAENTEEHGSWRFGLVALESAEFEEYIPADVYKIRDSFARALKLQVFEGHSFEDAVIEAYSLNAVKEEAYIYKVRKGAELAREHSLNMILDVFKKRDPFRGEGVVSTGHALYDCAAFLCNRERIVIAPRDKIRQSSGSGYTLVDIARISHFTIRDIILQADWYKNDYGAFIAFSEKDGLPYCLYPYLPGKYRAFDGKTGETFKVTAGFAKSLKPGAIMFYRPFPDEKITLKKLVLFGLQKVYPSDIVRLFILSIVGVLTGLLYPLLNELLFDSFIPLGNAPGLLQLGLVLLTCTLGNVAFTVVKNFSTFRSMNSMEYAVQSATIDRLFSLPESFFRQYDSAELGIMTMKVSFIYNVVADTLVNEVLSAVFSLAYIFRMNAYSGPLTRWAVIMLILAVGFVVMTGIRQVSYETEKEKVDRQVHSYMYQFITGIEKLRVSSSEERAMNKYLTYFTSSRKITMEKEKLTVMTGTFIQGATLLFSVVFYYFMVHGNIGLTIGGFTGFMAAFGSLAAAMFTIAQSFLVVNEVIPLYQSARPILETLPEISEGAALPGELTGDIEIDNVTFGYDPEAAPVLNDLSLHIAPKEYVGIVGASGCGKSTLLKLLMGFEKPQLGRIYYDGQDIEDLDKRELRKKFGVVLQDGGLISGSIYANITITSPNIKPDQVQEVIRDVGLEKDIAAMPMGLHTVINEGGSVISGGQAQRILIARAIVGKPGILFFDEATSALDNVTQAQVIDTLEKLDVTKVVIAHRLSTIVNCDRIIVMDKGRIVEEGSYAELMEQKGLFYSLAIRQI